MTTAKVRAIHREMQRAIVERHGTPFDAIYVCPHDTAAGCECRKPKPGMLTRAAREKRIDLKESWMIGDMESDVIAGRAAGCQTILVTDDKHATRADMVVGSLPEGVHAILSYSHAVRRRVGDA
jgi:D-glycero-D-manno-heptose 1,7-bisphosphate phosphatase